MSTTGSAQQTDFGDEGETSFRRCIATRERRPRETLIRFVLTPEGGVVADLEERLPGRGFWLSADRDVVNTACARNAFAKAAKRRVDVLPDLADRVEARLVGRCVSLLGLARRAGQAVAGFEKVRERLSRGEPAGVLVEASDGMSHGRAKIAGSAAGVPQITVLTSAELGQAWGRDRVVHVVLEPGKLADRLKAESMRLAGFRRVPERTEDGIAGRTDERTG